MSIIKIVNVETGEVTERAMTTEEISAKKAADLAAEAEAQAAAEAAAAKAALLAKLGITEEEAKLLLS